MYSIADAADTTAVAVYDRMVKHAAIQAENFEVVLSSKL